MSEQVTDAEVEAAYHGWRTAQRGSELQPGEYEATFSRVEFGWMRAALEAARRAEGADHE